MNNTCCWLRITLDERRLPSGTACILEYDMAGCGENCAKYKEFKKEKAGIITKILQKLRKWCK